jgi:hypothetical protein
MLGPPLTITDAPRSAAPRTSRCAVPMSFTRPRALTL